MSAAAPSSIPDRVWSPCGAGKSTVACRLAAVADVEPVHLDDIHWRPGWIEATRDEDHAAVAEVVTRPRWIVDGNYGGLRRENQDRVQLFVWLDLPLPVTFSRILRRCFVRSFRRVPCCNGNYESLWRTFFHHDSLLLWSLQTHHGRRRELAAELAGRPHVRLRSTADVERWVAAIEQNGVSKARPEA
jgi:hypothetical protein